MRIPALLLACAVLVPSAAQARRPPLRPNTEASIELSQLVDSDDGSLADDDTAAAFKQKLQAPALTAKLLKCAPIGRRYAMAMIVLAPKRSRVMCSGGDRKFTACVEAALSTVTGDEYTAVVQLSLAAPTDTSQEHYPSHP